MAIDQLDSDYPSAVGDAICAGIDMAMVPFDFRRFISTVHELVEADRIPLARIDDAVRRILHVKSELGLLASTPDPSVPLDIVGCDEHRALARTAVRASAVLLTDHAALPIPEDATILAAGHALDDIGICCGGWTISWEGSPGRTTDGSTILDGLRRLAGTERVRYDRAGDFTDVRASFGVVAVHELPYVEGRGDRADLSVPEDQLEVVRRMRRHVERLIVLVISGRPVGIEPIVELADAIVACWLPGSEADGIAELLLGDGSFSGRLPVAWPRDRLAHTIDTGPGPTQPAWPIGHSVAPTPETKSTGGE
jgi:beta-glucosidase